MSCRWCIAFSVLAACSTFAPVASADDPRADQLADGTAAPAELASGPPSEPEAPPATVQARFAPKAGTLSVHLLGTAQFRGDYYNRLGYGAALAYYPFEELGIELRATGYYAWLNDAAVELQRDAGLIPDTRAPIASVLLGGRVSFGYGKVQLGDVAIVHFDPQAVAQAGATFAEDGRALPTALLGLSLLLHFELGFQAQIELCAMFDLEERNGRGWIASVGFAPTVSIGWRFDPRSW